MSIENDVMAVVPQGHFFIQEVIDRVARQQPETKHSAIRSAVERLIDKNALYLDLDMKCEVNIPWTPIEAPYGDVEWVILKPREKKPNDVKVKPWPDYFAARYLKQDVEMTVNFYQGMASWMSPLPCPEQDTIRFKDWRPFSATIGDLVAKCAELGIEASYVYRWVERVRMSNAAKRAEGAEEGAFIDCDWGRSGLQPMVAEIPVQEGSTLPDDGSGKAWVVWLPPENSQP